MCPSGDAAQEPRLRVCRINPQKVKVCVVQILFFSDVKRRIDDDQLITSTQY